MTATSHSTAGSPAPVDAVALTIDGIEVSVPKGTLVIRAAEQLGIAIPRFCDHPLLAPAGACRQCLVEVAMPDREGNVRPMPKPQASCALEVSPGMVVKTQNTSDVAEKAQRGVMEFLLINHPLDCPVCDKGGECPLQNQAMANGQAESRFTETKRTFPKPINISTQVLLDRERCILCQRCTRFSEQIAGDPFIDLQMRGARQQIGTFAPDVLGYAGRQEPTVGAAMLDESGHPFSSYFSGNTVQICPVGALTGAAYRFRSRPFDLRSVDSACEHCASGCAMRTDIRRDVVLRRLSGDDPEVNQEWNCDKGRWAFQWASLSDRLTSPMVRVDGVLQPRTWPQALEAAAAGLRAAGTVGVLPGGRVTVEDAYAYAKFARLVLGTNDIDHRARAHSAEEAQFLAAHVAGTGLQVTYADLTGASAIFLVGLEPEEESPIVFLRLRAAGRPVFSVAPFATRSLAKLGGTLITAAPGEEPAVIAALAQGDGPAAAALSQPGCVILVGERLAGVPGALSAVAALSARTGARVAWVPRRAGERGAVDAGTLPGLLPGGRPVTDAAARQQVENVWGAPLPNTQGRDTSAILEAAARGDLGGLIVGGVDLNDLPDPSRAAKALASVGFLVSLEVRGSAITELADVILPVAPPAEKSGSFASWEGRARSFSAAVRTSAMADTRVLDALAAELGTELGLRSVAAARDELAALGLWSGERPAAPSVAAPALPALKPGQVRLATWHLLLDAGRLQDGEPYLAGTAHRAVARISPATAAELKVNDGDNVTVSTLQGSITVPAVVTPMPDGVVWLPQNSPRCTVYSSLGVLAGDAVSIAGGSR